jgi:hypothetical protein
MSRGQNEIVMSKEFGEEILDFVGAIINNPTKPLTESSAYHCSSQ